MDKIKSHYEIVINNNRKNTIIEEKYIVKAKNEDEVKKEKKGNTFNFKPLDNILEKLKENNLKVKAEKNYLKIEIKSQEDIDKLSSYFNLH